MTALTGIKLKSPVSRSAPVAFAQPFAMGAVPSGQYAAIDSANVAIFPLRLWNDGSLKHALVMGHFDLTANVEKLYTFSTTSTAPTAGTPLTAADIVSAAPTAVIDCGVFGTLSLASLLASPARTYVSTPEMVECHYQGPIGSDASLYGWFHVRKFKGENNCWVRAWAGNASLDGAARVTKNYNMRVTIGGNVVWDVASFKHMPMQRFDAVGWTAYDPQVQVRHDTGYLRLVKAAPNYIQSSPSQAEIDRWATTTRNMNPSGSSFVAVNDYFPGNNCNYTPYMPDQGFHEHIGVLPNWDAQFITSGAHPTLYKAVINNARGINSYGFCFVDNATKNPIKISAYPGWAGDGLGGSGNIPQTQRQGSTEALVWEGAHHGSAAYLAYLLTGEYYYLETMQFNANAAYLYETTGHGSGLNRLLTVQNRQRAWYMRSLSQVAAFYPTHMAALYQDTQTWLANLVTEAWQKYCNSTLLAPWLGVEDLYNNRSDSDIDEINSLAPDGEISVQIGLFEHFFVAMASHHATNIEALPSASMSKLSALRDYHAGVGVWPYSPQFNLSLAAAYTITIPSTQKSQGTFARVPVAALNPSTPADIYRASTKQVFITNPGNAQSSSSVELMTELGLDLSTFNIATLNSPIVITYHKNDTANTSGYLTGFPNSSVKVIESASVRATYNAGANVPYVEGSILLFAGILVRMQCYGRQPADGFQYTVTATTPPASTGAMPSTQLLSGYSGGDPTGTNGYWGNGKPVLAAALDVGKTGAAAARTNLVTAANYASTQGAANYADTPIMAIEAYSISPPTRNFAITDSGPGAPVTTPGPSLILDSTPLLGAGTLVLGPYQGHGIPLSAIVAGGSDGTSPIYDAIQAAGGMVSSLSEIRLVAAAGTHGTYSPDETGGGVYTGDGASDTINVDYFLDGAQINSAPMYFGTAPTSTVSGVVVSPSTATGSTTFTAVVNGTGSPSQAVTWTRSGSAGSINASTGAFIAPSPTGSVQTITITATSTQDSSKSGTATVTIAAAVGSTVTSVTVSPASIGVIVGSSQQFAASVAGTLSPSQAVTWTVSGAASISTSGLATGPIGTYTVTARSVQDNTKAGTALFAVLAPGSASLAPDIGLNTLIVQSAVGIAPFIG